MRIFSEPEPREHTGCSTVEESRVRTNLAPVRAVVAFGSARGGVGKSALLVNVAASLALAGRKIGVVDADLNSPSVAAMLAVKPGRRAFVTDEIEPGGGPLGLRIIGSEFLPEGEPPPVSFAELDEAPPVPQNGAHPSELGYLATMRRLLGRTRFGPLDLLLVDLGSGVEHIDRLLKIVPRAAIVLATHPSDLSARSMRLAIGIASQLAGGVIGVVENMAGFNCNGCHTVRPLMPYGAVSSLARELGAPLMERLPFDPRFAESCDRGVIFVREYSQTPLAKQLVNLSQAIDKAAESRRQSEEQTQ
jgi:ATP-binding protein involved in chromosome partitioning